MPYAFQPVTAGADDDRCFLSAPGAPAQRSQVVGKNLQRIEHVVEVLDLGEWPQASHGHPDGLPHDRALADSGIGVPVQTILLLQACAALIDVAEASDVLAHEGNSGVPLQRGIETGIEDLEPVE